MLKIWQIKQKMDCMTGITGVKKNRIILVVMVIFLLTVNYLKNNKSILSLKALARCPAEPYFLFKDKREKTKTTQQGIALHRVAEFISLYRFRNLVH